MKKKFLSPVVIGGVLLLGVGLTLAVRLAYRSFSSTREQAAPHSVGISISTVLQAHAGQNDKEWPRFTQTGTLTYHPNISAGSSPEFERKLRLSIEGSLVRYDKATLNKNHSYLFDGHTLVRTTFGADTRVEVKVIDGAEAASIRFQMATFGMVPILKRLSEPRTEVLFVGVTPKGNQFQVKTAGGSWYIYTSSNHLIVRLEVNDLNITYGDYRTVEGLTLPFYQEVKKGNKLLYEIKFETVDSNPVLAVGFFE